MKNYINFNTIRNTLSIDWDSLCVHILTHYKRMFSPAELERAALPELKKLEGLPVTDSMFDEIAKYIDEMTIYMHQQGLKLGEQRQEGMKERFEQYKEDFARAQKNRK